MKLWTDDTDTFIARDIKHLEDVYRERYGNSPAEMTGDDKEMENWQEVADDEPVTVVFDDSEEKSFPDDFSVEPMGGYWHGMQDPVGFTAPAKRWAEVIGPGFLCSTEW